MTLIKFWVAVTFKSWNVYFERRLNLNSPQIIQILILAQIKNSVSYLLHHHQVIIPTLPFLNVNQSQPSILSKLLSITPYHNQPKPCLLLQRRSRSSTLPTFLSSRRVSSQALTNRTSTLFFFFFSFSLLLHQPVHQTISSSNKLKLINIFLNHLNSVSQTICLILRKNLDSLLDSNLNIHSNQLIPGQVIIKSLQKSNDVSSGSVLLMSILKIGLRS